MNNSVYVLLGTAVGGVITIFVTWINSRKELAIKDIEFKFREKETKAANKTEFRKEKLIRYSKFSGSLQVTLGFLGDMIDIYQHTTEPTQQMPSVKAIIDHPDYEKAVKNLKR